MIQNNNIRLSWLAFLAAFLLAFCPRPAEAQSPTLDAFLTTLEQRTLQTDFTLTISEDVTQPLNYPGSITMRGKQFHAQMFDTDAAYDGNTLYIYMESTDELTLSTPTDQELLEANPFFYAQALVKVCNITERTSQDGSQAIITLTPKDQTIGIQRFTLRLQKATKLPLSLEIKEGRKSTTLTLKKPQYVATVPSFTLSYPDAYLNDLR